MESDGHPRPIRSLAGAGELIDSAFRDGPVDGLPSGQTVAALRADALLILSERNPMMRGGAGAVRLPTRRVTGKQRQPAAPNPAPEASAGAHALRGQVQRAGGGVWP
eukprot:11436130-Heterocapsa_arctica.AAC.1